LKKDRTVMLLFIMNSILEKFPKYEFVSAEAWQSLDSRTLKVVMEVSVGNEKSTN